MTQIRYREDGGRFYLSARGHATPEGTSAFGGEGGRDGRLVPTQSCAYISGILYSLAGYLRNAAEWGLVRLEKLRLESGDAELRFQGGGEARAAFQMAVIGLRQLEKTREDLIQVREETKRIHGA